MQADSSRNVLDVLKLCSEKARLLKAIVENANGHLESRQGLSTALTTTADFPGSGDDQSQRWPLKF
jgi:hypothetical protein